MYKLLIVDDLPVIVDGLLELFEGLAFSELEVKKAYSGEEALNALSLQRFDIVLSDIKMPGIEGIQLLREIKTRWPDCKVIFLTGYNEFQYAKDAMTYGAFDYILKVESDDKIVDAVERAIAKLEEERGQERLVRQAHASMRKALPSLQKDYLMGLLQGKPATRAELEELFRELAIPLDPWLPVHVLIGRIDAWKDMFTAPDKALLAYGMQNIGDEWLSRGARCQSVVFELSRIVWLIQPIAADDGADKAFRYAEGVLEAVQATCKRLLGLSVSFAIGREAAEWEEIADRFHAVKYKLAQGHGLLHEVVLVDRGRDEESSGEEKSGFRDGIYHSRVQLLTGCLENNHREPFYKLYAELTAVWNDPCAPGERKTELYHALSAFFLFYLHRNKDVCEYANTQLDLEPLFGRSDAMPWKELTPYYRRLADCFFEWNETRGALLPAEVVNKVHRYIEKHIATDISLTALADNVGLNPSYLSRLYKQMTGIGLSKYIGDYRNVAAQNMLLNTPMKVGDIAAALGYNSALAFIRFFKKQNGATPQEYRTISSARQAESQ